MNNDIKSTQLSVNKETEQGQSNGNNETLVSQLKTDDINDNNSIMLREDRQCIDDTVSEEKCSSEQKPVDDSVEILDAEGNWNIQENKNDEIVVTRMTENENTLSKDLPHLNSTENICSEYDAAMIYKANHNSISKSDVLVNINSSEKQNHFKYSRDDSGLNMKSEHKLKNQIETDGRLNKSEGNLIAAVKSGNLKRTSSKISKLSNEPLEWNFVYRSPYALSDKQKQNIIDRKVKMQKKKVQLEKRRQNEKEKRLQENQLAFEKWKQNKMKETTMKNKNVENIPGKVKSTFWYPT